MDRWQGIQAFWGSFGIHAYQSGYIPDDATTPYITYQASVAQFDKPIPLSGDIWYQSTSWAAISQKADQISKACGVIRISPHHYIHVTKGTPFAQRMTDADKSIRRIHINLMAEFYTDD